MIRSLVWLTFVLAVSPAAIGQQTTDVPGILKSEGITARLVRHGCGPWLYHVAGRLTASSGRADFVPESDSAGFRIVKGRAVARPKSDAPWSRVRGDPALLFPELLGRADFESRFVAIDGAFKPRRSADQTLPVRVEIKRGKTGRPLRVKLHFANGGLEVREYSDWMKSDPTDIGAVETVGEVAWPVEQEWGSRLERSLLAVEAALGELSDLSGEFVREKQTFLLSRPVTASGRFLFVPGRLLWIDEKPRASEVLITRKGLEIHDPTNRRLERFNFGDHVLGRYVFLGFGDPLAEGLRAMDPVVFKQGEDELYLELIPVRGELKKRVKRISFRFDRKSGMLRQLSYSDPTGDSVTTRFVSAKKNTGIDPKNVAIHPAPGTKIVENSGGMPWR